MYEDSRMALKTDYTISFDYTRNVLSCIQKPTTPETLSVLTPALTPNQRSVAGHFASQTAPSCQRSWHLVIIKSCKVTKSPITWNIAEGCCINWPASTANYRMCVWAWDCNSDFECMSPVLFVLGCVSVQSPLQVEINFSLVTGTTQPFNQPSRSISIHLSIWPSSLLPLSFLRHTAVIAVPQSTNFSYCNLYTLERGPVAPALCTIIHFQHFGTLKT